MFNGHVTGLKLAKFKPCLKKKKKTLKPSEN